MSGPAVVIGFILLVPSILGMIFSAVMLLSLVYAGGNEINKVKNEAIANMRANGVPESIITQVVANPDMDTMQFFDQLDMARYSWVKDSAEKIRAANTGSGIGVIFGGGFAIALGIASFVGGLLGWLLVMKKRVLQCSMCGAVVNAS